MPIKPENYQRVRNHIFLLLGRKCVMCSSTENLEFDHIVPNGYARRSVSSERVWEWLESYDKHNLQVLCGTCNKIKSDKLPIAPKQKDYYYSNRCDRFTKCIECRSSPRCHKSRQVSPI